MIRPATLADLRARGQHLFAEADAETGMAADVQWDLLEDYDRAGVLLLLAVEMDACLVGYCCAAVSRNLWQGTTSCQTLSVYVQPAHRGRWGWPLLRELAKEAELRGADDLRVNALPGSRLAMLLERKGLTPRAVAYGASIMHYTAHARSSCAHHHGGAPVRGLCGRASTHGAEEGPAQPG